MNIDHIYPNLRVRALPPGFRVSRPEPGPLSDGGQRWVGRLWAIDLDRHGRAAAIVAWPLGLGQAAYLRGARRAVARAEADAADCEHRAE